MCIVMIKENLIYYRLMNRDLELIEDFLSYEKEIKALSDNTLINYRLDLIYLDEFLSKRGIEAEDVRKEDAREITRLLTKNFSESSVLRHLTTYRTFYSYLLRHDIVSLNPFDSVSLRRQNKHLPSVLTEDEVKELLAIPYSDFLEQRDHILFLFLYSTGCRISEALSVDVRDIEWSARRIKIVGKGSKERYVFLPKKLVKELEGYIKERNSYLESKKNAIEEALFIGESGKRLPFSSAHIIFDKYKERLGWQKEFTPHTLRHSFATHMMDRGADIRLVQELLGHESISTTQIYTHVSKERLKNVYNASHPHAKGR